jgi:hypothetical protein
LEKKTSHLISHLFRKMVIPDSLLSICPLVYQIDVLVRLLILRKNPPLHGLILVCMFIDFEKKIPPARLFHPARLLVCLKGLSSKPSGNCIVAPNL